MSFSIMLLEGKGEELNAQGGEFFMFNLVVEKEESEEHDQSRSNITRPRTCTPTGFV